MTYIDSVVHLAHDIIDRHRASGMVAVDATLGKGSDTQFLATRFQHVHAFEVQGEAVDAYRQKAPENVLVHHRSHADLDQVVDEPIDVAMYNLGFLHGGDRTIITRPESTLASLAQASALLAPGGLITIAIYAGHKGGEEERAAVLDWLAQLEKSRFSVLVHSYHNRADTAPSLAVVERR